MALMYSSKVAQPARRVKDKRLRRAFGILDTACWLGFMAAKGLLPTLSNRVDLAEFGWAVELWRAMELFCDYCFVAL